MENSNINVAEQKKSAVQDKVNTIQEIDHVVNSNKEINKARAVPYIYIAMIVVAICSGYASSQPSITDNMKFTFSFLAFALAAVGILGVVIPKRVMHYLPSKEKVIRKQFYLPSAKREEVIRSLQDHSRSVVKEVEDISATNSAQSTGASTIKVILYYTKSGSFISGQVFDYVPYEFVPHHNTITFSANKA